MIIECDTVNQNEPLRQGDIFEFANKISLWKKYGVIITTDCDIANGKNSDVFSYCPIIGIRDYLLSIFIRKQIKPDMILDKIKKIIDKNNKIKGKKGVDLSIICPWIMERGIENALSDINISSNEIKELISFIYNHEKYFNSFDLYLLTRQY
jgi:hypothetical protein